MQVESGDNAQALSPRGAMGLMQIMPETYRTLRQAFGLGADPYQPRDNIMAGVAYLREMLDLYGTSGFLAAYNAGPARYDEHLATGEPLPEETQIYLSRLAPLLFGARNDDILATANSSDWMTASLFIGDRTMSNSATISENVVGFSNAHAHASQRPLAPDENATIAALAPKSEGLFISSPSGPMDQRP
jgi:SLT domain-containing protein